MNGDNKYFCFEVNLQCLIIVIEEYYFLRHEFDWSVINLTLYFYMQFLYLQVLSKNQTPCLNCLHFSYIYHIYAFSQNSIIFSYISLFSYNKKFDPENDKF